MTGLKVCFDCKDTEGEDEHALHECKVCNEQICEGCSADHAIQECGWGFMLD